MDSGFAKSNFFKVNIRDIFLCRYPLNYPNKHLILFLNLNLAINSLTNKQWLVFRVYHVRYDTFHSTKWNQTMQRQVKFVICILDLEAKCPLIASNTDEKQVKILESILILLNLKLWDNLITSKQSITATDYI